MGAIREARSCDFGRRFAEERRGEEDFHYHFSLLDPFQRRYLSPRSNHRSDDGCPLSSNGI